jgi:hypothetical protein
VGAMSVMQAPGSEEGMAMLGCEPLPDKHRQGEVRK